MDLLVEQVENCDMVGVVTHEELVHVTGKYEWSSLIRKRGQAPVECVRVAQIDDGEERFVGKGNDKPV